MAEPDSKPAARLFHLTKRGAVNEIAERTWRDLSMDAIFTRIDRCITGAGRQHLYRRLRTPSLSPNEIETFDERVKAFESDPTLRDRFRKAAKPLDVAKNKDSYALADALYGEPVVLPKKTAPLFRLGSITAMLTAVLTVVWPYAIVLFLVCLIGNIALRLSIHGQMSLHAGAMGSAFDLITTAESTTKSLAVATDAPILRADVSAGRVALDAIRSVVPSLRWLTLDVLKMNEMTAILITYLNVVFLLDVNAFIKSARVVQKHRPALKKLFDMVGELDVAQAVASFRASAGTTTSKPLFLPAGSSIKVEGMTHPLLDRDAGAAVPNDATLDAKRGWLIMGSNMSGKSTFLRALALQAILAQTIACTTATKYEAPVTIVRTLMHIEDDLLAGQSHFRVEAEASRDILLEPTTSDEADRLCVVDELFRGTNTADRVAAGSAFLRAVSKKKGAFVVAATHDSELIDLLGKDFKPHYFQEKIEGGELTFDYVLHEGPVAPRNAMAVLALVGYPEDVLAEARAHLEKTSART